MTTTLNPIYSNQKSFYKKANVETHKDVVKLESYNTIVAVKQGNKISVKGYFSKTTAIHINEFLMQSGAEKLSKKELDLCPTIEL